MHFLLGLTALVLGAVIATRRTRPAWFVITTGVLVGLGALFAVLSFARVTDALGIVALNVIGWIFVGLALITMLSAVFVLERRGPRGEELPPLIGDNPFDGDTDDSDDSAPGTAPAAPGEGAAPAAAPAAALAVAATDAPQDGTVVVGADPDIATPDGEAAIEAEEAQEAAAAHEHPHEHLAPVTGSIPTTQDGVAGDPADPTEAAIRADLDEDDRR